MVITSDRFHEAIRSDAPQTPLFIFDGGVVIKNDIDLSSGFRFQEAVMDGDDFEPGACCSSTLDFQLMNEDGEWSAFPFGDFTAYLGAQTFHRREKQRKGCVVLVGGNTIQGSDQMPYLTMNGQTVAGANAPVYAAVLFRDMLLAFTEQGYLSFRYSGGEITPAQANIHDVPLLKAAESWKRTRTGICYGHQIPGITTGVKPENCLTVTTPNTTVSYEMVLLGKFTAERPVFSTKRRLSVRCYDAMQKFDTEYTPAQFSYPTTLYGLLEQTCKAAGVALSGQAQELTNGSASIPKAPELKNATLKDLLHYIGQLSGTFAKVGRDGALTMKWLSASGFSLDGHDYSECSIGYYTAAPISKVVCRTTGGEDSETGAGENPYYIVDNPLLAVMGG